MGIRTHLDLISGEAAGQPLGSPDSGRVYQSVPCKSSIANLVETAAVRSPPPRDASNRATKRSASVRTYVPRICSPPRYSKATAKPASSGGSASALIGRIGRHKLRFGSTNDRGSASGVESRQRDPHGRSKEPLSPTVPDGMVRPDRASLPIVIEHAVLASCCVTRS